MLSAGLTRVRVAQSCFKTAHVARGTHRPSVSCKSLSRSEKDLLMKTCLEAGKAGAKVYQILCSKHDDQAKKLLGRLFT